MSFGRQFGAAIGACICAVLIAGVSATRAGDGTVDPATGDMDFTVSFRYPPTTAALQTWQQTIRQMSFGLCDATDGQIRVRRVTIVSGQETEDLGDFWVHATPGRAGGGTGWLGNFGVPGARQNMHPSELREPDVWLHEMGHQAFGLGEQYPEQRRFGGECGIGRGFQPGTVDEQNHSIMQLSGRMQCVGGSSAGTRCIENSECGGGSCQFVNMSEMSMPSNHDPVQGTDTVCPAARPLSEMIFTGSLNSGATIQSFDDTDFSTADAASSHKFDFEAMDSLGKLPAERVFVYATRTDKRKWQMTAVIDEKVTGGTAGDMVVLESWELEFNMDGSLRSVSEQPAETDVVGLATGAADLNLTLNFGTPDPTDTTGAGEDGLRHGGGVELDTSADVFPQCGDQCARRWNTGTSGWETTHHTLWKGTGNSDWEWAQRVFPFLSIPTGLPQAAPSPRCFRNIEFDVRVDGSDQVLMLIDKSGSMAWSSKEDITEVCGNGIDDDEDGNVDESGDRQCADSRMLYAQTAAKAYLDLQRNSGIDVGVLEFDDTQNLRRQITSLNASNAGAIKTDIDNLTPGGNTGIGDALAFSVVEFSRVADVARARTAYLMTDGFNTAGIDPADGAAQVEDIGVRVHVIPAGTDVNDVELGAVAATTSGAVVPARDITELTSVYAELAGRHQGAALSVPRTNFVLSTSPGQYPEGFDTFKEGKITRTRGFAIEVEKNADKLTAFLAGRNARLASWDVEAKLESPSGVVFDAGHPSLSVEPGYVFFDIIAPEPGTWRLFAEARGTGLQRTTILAYVVNPLPDLFVGAKPRQIRGGDVTTVAINPSFVIPMKPEALTLTGTLTAPDGSVSPLPITFDRYGRSWSAETPPLLLNGLHRARVTLEVGPGAEPMPGEPISDGPAVSPVEVIPFERVAETFILVTNGKDTACRNPNDCDNDGIRNENECPNYGRDIDGDGRPNLRDTDSDGDEIPDAVEGNRDIDDNGVPDRCEPGPVSTPVLIEKLTEEARNREPQLPMREDCIPFDRDALRLKTDANGAHIVENRSIIWNFGDKRAAAKQTVKLLDHYKADRICYVGRQDPSLTYLLSGTTPPKGPFENEDCIGFKRDRLEVKEIGGRWKIVDGSNWLFNFDKSEAEARQSLAIVRKYQFNYTCYVGRPKPPFSYLRR